jgi:hypothetical protein
MNNYMGHWSVPVYPDDSEAAGDWDDCAFSDDAVPPIRPLDHLRESPERSDSSESTISGSTVSTDLGGFYETTSNAPPTQSFSTPQGFPLHFEPQSPVTYAEHIFPNVFGHENIQPQALSIWSPESRHLFIAASNGYDGTTLGQVRFQNLKNLYGR